MSVFFFFKEQEICNNLIFSEFPVHNITLYSLDVKTKKMYFTSLYKINSLQIGSLLSRLLPIKKRVKILCFFHSPDFFLLSFYFVLKLGSFTKKNIVRIVIEKITENTPNKFELFVSQFSNNSELQQLI